MRKYILNFVAVFVMAMSTISLGTPGVSFASDSSLPVSKIEAIVQIPGNVENGVLDISVARSDIGEVKGPENKGVTFDSAFEIHGDLYFQPLGKGKALLNGDLALKETEVNPFIYSLIKNGLVVQAFHQHLPMHPQVWFVHFRGVDDPIKLANKIHNAIKITDTPLPQSAPSNPTTPLDADRLAKILHGTATVGEEGVVTVSVNRKDKITIDGVRVQPETGISTTIEFKPLSETKAAAVPDFSMTADEVMPVMKLMLVDYGWYQGCLYNQETDETPQLYFDHMLKTGDAYKLAKEIREGLNLTDSE